MSLEEWVNLELSQLADAGLLRVSEPPVRGAGFIDAFSNDYFGLAHHVVSRATLLGRSPGAGSSRLIFGTTEEHERLEAKLASWVRQQSALLFSSGYAANVGVLSALADPQTTIISDELNHASIIDGCRLAKAEVCVVPHLDTSAVEEALAAIPTSGRALVVTESYFSMDGDSPNLAALAAVCKSYGAGLIVDEAHALGAFGPEGAGLCAQANVSPDVLIGTLGKAVGVQGAFVACNASMKQVLWNKARSFVFSTAISPVLAALTENNLDELRRAEAPRQYLEESAQRLRTGLADLGLPCSSTRGPIVPLRTDDWDTARRCEDHLREKGILTRAVRPPTVPAGTDRVRLTVHADWEPDSVGRIINAIRAALR